MTPFLFFENHWKKGHCIHFLNHWFAWLEISFADENAEKKAKKKKFLKIQQIFFWTDVDVDVDVEINAVICHFAFQNHIGAWFGSDAERGDVCVGSINGFKNQIGKNDDILWKWCWLID